ncbi:hypothetical protein OTK49_02915 [Vibrio coralliirubri]|uniref:hypothetical protein n=1 Tax=Vibrio coralliirubri TaxID=1516159 RepID=UPI002284E6CD|nr:hypothetical protein [Vibrio coralliirubri]MCY9861466.1 hypothetical protein [Vibrio coralliirubri]
MNTKLQADVLKMAEDTTFTCTINDFQQYLKTALIIGYTTEHELNKIRIFKNEDESASNISFTTDISFPCIVRLSKKNEHGNSTWEVTQEKL